MPVMLLAVLFVAQPRLADTVENFDDGTVVLLSYPGQDADPDSWRLDSVVTHRNSPYSLRLHGNTWKVESIAPAQLDSGDVWQVAARVESLGEVHGFGLAAGGETLLYALAGTEEVDPWKWITVYQGAFPLRQWNVYLLPVGEDWLSRFGGPATVTALVFVNDRDAGPRGICYFDDVLDVTADRPVAPAVEAWYETGNVTDNLDGSWSVTVRFHSRVTDPDSPEHEYCWSFGDDSTSRDSAPVHTYTVRDNHEYTALLEVTDDAGLRGRAACRVAVDPGPTTYPVRVSFVGDIMLARRYENPGGIIDTMGPEGVFDSIRPWLRGADITVANLESPLTANGTRHPTKPIVFRGRPGNVRGLAHAGIDVVSLANNHVIDYGLEGMREMQESLAGRRILFSGAGANSYEAYLPVFCQRRGVNVAFLRACDRNGQYDNYQPYLDAGMNKPGFAMLDTYHLRQQIRAVREVADAVVVELHTGEEYELTPAGGGDRGTESPSEREGEEWYSPLALFPAPGDTEERHRAIEAGADLVVCHHPHLLQGFEVYQGKLIAHSLGDFAFDLEYPETYPTVILNGEIDETGFARFTVVPAYIDDYIPRRARGGLAAHILDDLARRSRDMNTWLVVNRESALAEIVLDTGGLLPTVARDSAQLRVRLENGWWQSEPCRLPRRGSLSRVVSAGPGQSWQYRVGREIVWVGSFEDEGSSLWSLNQPDESYDTVACEGRRSLCQRRARGTAVITTGLEERMVCYSDSSEYTLFGALRTQNAESAGIAVKLYTGRIGGTPVGTAELGVRVSGNSGWTRYCRGFTPAAGSAFFDVWLQSKGPDSGEGRVWFDDAGVVEWSAWQPLAGPESIAVPNDFYWAQVRTNQQVMSTALTFEETDYGPPVGLAGEARSAPERGWLRVYPNPARRLPTVEYSLAREAEVRVGVYDVLGQRVRVLVSGLRPAGRNRVFWDGLDGSRRRVADGAYFLRLESAGRTLTAKLVLAR
jgi:poly-gamma-glutamate synthesis protein (capsule biosynthesis protein)